MESAKFRAIHAKFDRGDKLTDRDLTTLIAYYDNLVKALDVGYLPQFALMQREAWSNQRRLHYIREARTRP